MLLVLCSPSLSTPACRLGNLSTYGTAIVAREIYKALGVPTNHGYSQDGGHMHCSFPADQNAPLTAFVQKFLFGASTNTDILTTTATSYMAAVWNYTQWVDWATPSLM